MKMFTESLTGRTIETMARGLDSASLRHRVISNNIANVNTPGFKRQSVIFEDFMPSSKIRAKTLHSKHIRFSTEVLVGRPKIIIENDTTYRNDGNNVDINQEMADLEKNTIYYNAIATKLASKFRLLKLVAQGGK
ncbi:TPA: flagellar basal body rod protein FlgB [bacterium]|nr:flagellar basal body rod protein FlgB [bacterium]